MMMMMMILVCAVPLFPRTLAYLIPGRSVSVVKAPPLKCRLLILPGFCADSQDYTSPNSMVPALLRQGWQKEQVTVLPVSRYDWMKVFALGATDHQFWRSNAPPTNPAFSWYLERISNELKKIGDDERVVLVGHSAGGWLGRAAVGFGSVDSNAPAINLEKIIGIVTLGTPNMTPPDAERDPTRGALRITNERFPGAYFKESMFYLSVVGKAPHSEESGMNPLCRDGYETLCGNGHDAGDGVVPVRSGLLEGSVQITLDGVRHIEGHHKWYGTAEVVHEWNETMLKEILKLKETRIYSKLHDLELDWAET